MEEADDGLDIESRIRQLLVDYEGIDIVLAFMYNDGESKQNRYFIQHTEDKEVCRRLCHMLWESMKGGSFTPEPDDSEDE